MAVSNPLHFYGAMPWRVRLHVNGRWRLCPFRRLADYLPDQGRLVDIGSGYGLWPFYVHTLQPALDIWGLELDQTKVQIARKVVQDQAIKGITFVTSNAQVAEFPACRIATIIDVLYLIHWDEQVEILRKLIDILEPGGKLLVKEIGEAPAWKYAWNWFEEWLAVRVVKITRGNRFYFRTNEGWAQLLRSLGLEVQTVRLDQGYMYPHVLFVGEKKL